MIRQPRSMKVKTGRAMAMRPLSRRCRVQRNSRDDKLIATKEDVAKAVLEATNPSLAYIESLKEQGYHYVEDDPKSAYGGKWVKP